MDIPLGLVKLRCSLRWLCGVLSDSSLLQENNVSKLLLEPYEDGTLKRDLVHCLTSPRLYLGAYNLLFPSDHVKGDSFEPLIHGLAKRGGYVLEDDSTIVTDPMLAQQDPLRVKSHLAVLDVLMQQYSSRIITVHQIIKAVKQISTFNSSKELPSKVDVALLLILWLNKVSEAVFVERHKEVKKLLQEPDLRQRRRNKAMLLQSGGDTNPAIPRIEKDLCSGILDGRSLATLLLHYAPQDCTWNDFEFSIPLKKKKIFKNLQFVSEYCSTHIPSPGFHISPQELMEWGKSGLLTTNALALLSRLFQCFEMKGSDLGIKKSSSLVTQSSVPQPPTAPRPPTRNGNLHSASDGAINKLPTNATPSQKLPPHSGSNSRVFQAPFRSSLNANQSKALATFSKDKFSLLHGIHTQSSPLLQLQTAKSNELISISTENLDTHNQIRFSNRGGVVHRGQSPLRISRRKDKVHTEPRSSKAEPANFTDGEKDNSNGSTVPPPPVSSAAPVKSAVRESFTLNKQHTYASASAAGLPIINDKDKSSSDRVGTAKSEPCKSANKSRGEVLALTVDRAASFDIATQPQPIPANVKTLRSNVMSFITTLETEDANFDMEAKIQRLKLCHPVKGGATSDKAQTSSATVQIPESSTDPCDAKPTVDLKEKETQDKKLTFQLEVTPSLEQFQRDEVMIQQEASPDTKALEEREPSSKTASPSYVPVQTLPFSPIDTNGQVFIEKTPSLQSQSFTDVHSQAAAGVKDSEVDPRPNPWGKPANKDDKDQVLENMKKREQDLRKKLVERDLARKTKAEQRKMAEKADQVKQQQHQKKKRQTGVISSHHTHGLEAVPDHSEHRTSTGRGGTIHFLLSTHDHESPQDHQQEAEQLKEKDEELQQNPELGPVGVYNGPECYVKPKSKSNLQIIRNAICAVCLAGVVNMSLKQKILVEMDKSSATHVVILFRDTIGFKFRGIYSYNQGDRHILKIYGNGPKEIKESMISHLYKYNSGQKEFKEIPSRSLSVSVDGLTIKTEYWHTAKRKTIS